MGEYILGFFILLVVIFIARLGGASFGRAQSAFSRAIIYTHIPTSASVIGVDESNGLAIAEDESALLLGTNSGSGFAVRKVPITEILSVEIVEDGDSITSTSRGSQLAGAVVGDLLLGPAGAIIGGLSGSRRNVSLCRRIDLRVTVNDMQHPVHTVCFQNSELKKTNPMYAHNFDVAKTWQAKVAVLIKRGERLSTASQPVAAHLLAPALAQLAELRDKGVLSSDEFEVQKRRLCGSGQPVVSVIERFEPPAPEPKAVLSSPRRDTPKSGKPRMSTERKAELMAKARALAAERTTASPSDGEHRLDPD